jgi:hypothetical protein
MKTNYLSLICLFLIIFTISSQEKSKSSATLLQNNEILYPPIGFEHPLHFDVTVKVVNCDGTPSLLVTTFNENREGKDLEISFQITINDINGRSEVFNFPKKTYQFGKMFISTCSNLTYNAVSTLDWTTDNTTKSITIKFDYEN